MQLFKKKSAHKITVANRAIEFEVERGHTLLEAALDNDVAMPHDCKVGSCGTCRFVLLKGKTRELSPSALALTKAQLEAQYRLACQTIPRSDLLIDFDESATTHDVPAEQYSGKISRYERLCHDILGISLVLDRPVSFVAGQYAKISLPDCGTTRQYSFANAPLDGGSLELDFHVRRVPGGSFTEWLFAESRIDYGLEVSAPYGTFYLRGGKSPILCIAGGSGLAPIVSILKQAHSQRSERPVKLLYGARHTYDLYFDNQISALAEAWAGEFSYLPVLSEEIEGSDWSGARGMVTEHISNIPNLSRHQAYLCGPPPMVDAAEEVLLQAGLSPTNIHADRFLDLSHNQQ